MSHILSDKKLINGGQSESQSDDEQSFGQPISTVLSEKLAAEVSNTLDWPEDKKVAAKQPSTAPIQQTPMKEVVVPVASPPPPPPSQPPLVPIEQKLTQKSDPKFLKAYDRILKWSDNKNDINHVDFKKQLDEANSVEKLEEIYRTAQLVQKRLNDKKRREKQKKAKQKAAAEEKSGGSKKDDNKMEEDAKVDEEVDDGGDDDDVDVDDEDDDEGGDGPFSKIETLKEVHERLDREDRAKKLAVLAEEAAVAKKQQEDEKKKAEIFKAAADMEAKEALLSVKPVEKVIGAPNPVEVQQATPKKRSRSKKEPEPDLGGDEVPAKRAFKALEVVTTVTPITDATTITATPSQPPPPPAPPPPRLDILRFVFGSKFMENLAQSLINKGAASVVGSLAQQSFLVNLADSTIGMLRPDLADEANDVTSKSSSVADKETVRALRQINATPKMLFAKLQAKRLSEIGNAKLSPDMSALVGFASMAAAGALLNATLVTNAERTKAVIAMATAEYNKREHGLAMHPLISHSIMPKLLIDADLQQNWRLAANRYTMFDCTEADFTIVRWSSSNPISAVQPVAKRFRIDESKNTTSDSPSTPFIMSLKSIGAYGLSAADNDRVFKYNASKLFKDRCDIMHVMPNRTMMALFSMMFEALNTPESVPTLLAPLHREQARSVSARANVPRVFRPTNAFASMFSCLSDTTVIDVPKRYYEHNPNVPHSTHETIIQQARWRGELYSANHEQNVLVKELHACDLAIAHILFSFMRLDPRASTFIVGEAAFHPAARVVSSPRDHTGTEVLMGYNELPVGVSVRVPDLMRRVLQRLWQRWLTHIGLWNEKIAQMAEVTQATFVSACDAAKYGANQWIADYFKKSFTPTDEQRLLFREALLPVMFAIFPPGFCGAVPDKK